MEKRTFRNCRFYRSGDVLFADMEKMWDDVCDAPMQHALLQGDGVHLSDEGNAFYARMLRSVFLAACGMCADTA